MTNVRSAKSVSVYRDVNISGYCKEVPFHPSVNYPEYPFRGHLSASPNATYEAVRQALRLLKLDAENFDTPHWNPLKDIVKPGDKVLLKPNFVLDRHDNGGNIECVVTQPDVIRAVCDYVYIALHGEGEIIIADAPQADCDFENLLSVNKVRGVSDFYKSAAAFDLPVYDLRQLRLRDFRDHKSRIIEDGDPLGYAVVNMGGDSSFSGLTNMDKIYGADYDRRETVKHHNTATHEYCVSRSVLSADVIVSIPKMKVHGKAGVTLNLKNLIGINGNKNYLPHFRVGLPEDGGDEFQKLTPEQKTVMYSNRRLIDVLLARPGALKLFIYNLLFSCYKIFRVFFPESDVRNAIRGGDWAGNDTIWRTLLDLNKILLYADAEGALHKTPQRRFFSVIDGIIAGEKEGALVSTDKVCGVIVCGGNPLLVDLATARLMGFDVARIPKFRHALDLKEYRLSEVRVEDIDIFSNVEEYCQALRSGNEKFLEFTPSKGWLGVIEY